MDTKGRATYAIGCGGFPPRQVVCNFTSASEVGGPLEVYVGVNEGNQKSGSLLRRAAACSRSIWRNAASSASCASFSAAVESNANFRFVPRPDQSKVSWKFARKVNPVTCYFGTRRCDSRGGSQPKLPFLEIRQDTLSGSFFGPRFFLLCFLLQRF